jgi:dienelactone hydrolase
VKRGFVTFCAALLLAGCGGDDASDVRAKVDYTPKAVALEELSHDELFRDVSFMRAGKEVVASIVVPTKRTGKVPVVVWAHAYRAGRQQFASEATRLAGRGIGSIMWDSNLTSFNRGAVDLQDPVYAAETFETFLRNDVINARVLLDIAEKQPAFDTSRVAFVGVDYGAMVGGVLAASEDRIDAFVLAASFPEPSKFFANELVPPETVDSFVDRISPYDPVHLLGAVDKPILLQNARRDSQITQEEYERLDDAADGAEVKWYESDHQLVVEADYDRDAWLAEKLGVASGS